MSLLSIPTVYTEQVPKKHGYMNHILKIKSSAGAAAQACDPTYWGGGDGEDCGSGPVKGKSSQDRISINDWTQWFTPVIAATK
jgi:hypothetical protein